MPVFNITAVPKSKRITGKPVKFEIMAKDSFEAWEKAERENPALQIEEIEIVERWFTLSGSKANEGP